MLIYYVLLLQNVYGLVMSYTKGITVFKILIWGGISSDMRSEI